ncbi:hypothetical protein C5167_005352 [Papaver somniferum]|uniref:FAD-binding PCMH-type domain-containing protein n=1 Tax=Papaver somniferum TaxID=3469 RepID=A0A4Y7JDS2_PAPSO|nr:berberine bridge enzyme-like 8 [Papaver somniferum]RZC58051.1 hypothetical protein C5167_005352 [Papaver somniferum]
MGTLSNFFSIMVLLLFTSFVFSVSLGMPSSIHCNFLHCLDQSSQSSIPVYTPNNSNYLSILKSTIQNLKFLSSTTPKPHLIIAPLHQSHVQAIVVCSRRHGIQIKVRSGGHDYEGLSYVSDVPFLIVDMFNLRSITVDVEDRTAWVQSGALLGELYYRIAEQSHVLGFPAGVCPTVGAGGYFSGGGYGAMLRKYGLAADNVIDAQLVDVRGRILSRESMGEDLFWAIRGGGGGSFGIIISWKIKLVDVPPIVTVFTISKILEQGATSIVHKWQEIAHKLPNELFIRVLIKPLNSTKKMEKTVQASFNSLFLGDAEKLLILMKDRFPELGLRRKDCIETSWIRSTLYFANYQVEATPDILLNMTQAKEFSKGKSDYVKEPIPQIGLQGIWKRLLLQEDSSLTFTPYGGRMNEISEYEIPFPHRNGTFYQIMYKVSWKEAPRFAKQLSWIRELYSYMAPYVSKNPRQAYVNYRDLDLGRSKNGTTNYLRGRAWGTKYFKNNYERLVYVKSKYDPYNFFRNEQSIPTVALPQPHTREAAVDYI